MSDDFRSGFVAVLGRPNVGKSTLVNALVGRKVSITLTPEARVGDYVLLHTGYAINVLNEEEAQETLTLLERMVEAGESGD